MTAAWDNSGEIPPLIAFRDPVAHARRRRPWNRAFSVAALKEYEQILRKRAIELVEVLTRDKGVVDLSELIGCFSSVARRLDLAGQNIDMLCFIAMILWAIWCKSSPRVGICYV